MRKSERYIAAVRRWVPMLWKEPNGLLAGSCWFILTCLPVVTFGPAWLSLVHYMRARERGEKRTWAQACAFSFGQCGARAWVMGLSDMLALLMAGGSALAVLEGDLPVAAGFAYTFLFVLDALYIASGMFRYPALNMEPQAKVSMMMARGALMAVGNVGWLFMFLSVQLLALIVCALTGVGVLLLYPAAAALLSACAYGEMVKAYLPAEVADEE